MRSQHAPVGWNANDGFAGSHGCEVFNIFNDGGVGPGGAIREPLHHKGWGMCPEILQKAAQVHESPEEIDLPGQGKVGWCNQILDTPTDR
jgi:hypothetical protein